MKFNRGFKYVALSCDLLLLQSTAVIPAANADTPREDPDCRGFYQGKKFKITPEGIIYLGTTGLRQYDRTIFL